MENLPWLAKEFGKLARGIWKNLPLKTVVPKHNQPQFLGVEKGNFLSGQRTNFGGTCPGPHGYVPVHKLATTVIFLLTQPICIFLFFSYLGFELGLVLRIFFNKLGLG